MDFMKENLYAHCLTRVNILMKLFAGVWELFGLYTSFSLACRSIFYIEMSRELLSCTLGVNF